MSENISITKKVSLWFQPRKALPQPSTPIPASLSPWPPTPNKQDGGGVNSGGPLPNKLLLDIFQLLLPQALCKAGSVCRRWGHVVRHLYCSAVMCCSCNQMIHLWEIKSQGITQRLSVQEQGVLQQNLLPLWSGGLQGQSVHGGRQGSLMRHSVAGGQHSGGRPTATEKEKEHNERTLQAAAKQERQEGGREGRFFNFPLLIILSINVQ